MPPQFVYENPEVNSFSYYEKDEMLQKHQPDFYQEDNYDAMEEFSFARKSKSEELGPTSNKNDSKGGSRRVSFSHVNIREHSVILGDHPCCDQGLPVTLGWNIKQEQKFKLEEYECIHQKRGNFRLSLEDRSQILNLDLTDHSVKRQQRKLARERREGFSRNRLQLKEKASFFRQQKPLTRAAATNDVFDMFEAEEPSAFWVQEGSGSSSFFVLQ
mmetsp:Transcript_22669/g.33470  ORF Transcript_22669/g.33470 Transcript_22669/m.33470 type:complete len:215 (+) Transcript_22669:95-739(+)|eukprot:CAMPEP_0194225996 /NCGR_PEP_ID=MMETSP0156-20130528/40876_1 /TAXON_ID=33649 /ORGANISM="Thalassionema nitzschioides, Strain L26-B" /LENGTH=214 /DNA_ID=CAMNT_0038958169 /DNA_START=18 /DNA_END=662 /DNA_ORIENTATION=-